MATGGILDRTLRPENRSNRGNYLLFYQNSGNHLTFPFKLLYMDAHFTIITVAVMAAKENFKEDLFC